MCATTPAEQLRLRDTGRIARRGRRRSGRARRGAERAVHDHRRGDFPEHQPRRASSRGGVSRRTTDTCGGTMHARFVRHRRRRRTRRLRGESQLGRHRLARDQEVHGLRRARRATGHLRWGHRDPLLGSQRGGDRGRAASDGAEPRRRDESRRRTAGQQHRPQGHRSRRAPTVTAFRSASTSVPPRACASRLPRQSQVTASSGDGAITIEQVNGKITLTTTDGSVRASRVSGELFVRSGDGAIRMDRVEGKLRSRNRRRQHHHRRQADDAARPHGRRQHPPAGRRAVARWLPTGTCRPATEA